MAGAAFALEAQGLDAVAALLDRLASPDLGGLMEGLGAAGESQTRRRIEESKASPAGTAWAPLSEKWQRRKRDGVKVAGVKLSSDGGILEFQGDLLDSLTYNVLGEREVEWGSNLVYAATHQFGDDRRNIPQREFLGLSGDDVDELLGLARDYVESLVDG